MKFAPLLLLLWCIPSLCCDQVQYDRIYKYIIQTTLQSENKRVDFLLKAQQIEALRKLCNGQKSSYEKP